MTMNPRELLYAKIRKYAIEPSSSAIEESKRWDAIIADVHEYLARERYSFNSAAHMDAALIPQKHKVGDVKYESTVEFVERRKR